MLSLGAALLVAAPQAAATTGPVFFTNADERQVNWQFTTSDARIKLRRLYPVL